MSKELLQRALFSKTKWASHGHQKAGAAYVTYDGSASDLNELARYVDRLESAIRTAIAQPNNTTDKVQAPKPVAWRSNETHLCNWIGYRYEDKQGVEYDKYPWMYTPMFTQDQLAKYGVARYQEGKDDAQPERPSPSTKMTVDEARNFAWSETKKAVGTVGWTVGDHCNYQGFFNSGWDNRGQFEKQRTQPVQPASPVAPSAPVAWALTRGNGEIAWYTQGCILYPSKDWADDAAKLNLGSGESLPLYTSSQVAQQAADIHSCSYFCDRPACIKAQRDEMRDAVYGKVTL